MANTMIHLTAVEDLLETLRQGPVQGPLLRAMEENRGALRLGGILLDLPFFSLFPLKVVLHLARRSLPYSPWGQTFHFHRPGTLTSHLFRTSRREARLSGESWPLALVAGVLSHLALDREVHPRVEEVVRSQLATGLHPDVLHDRCEAHQNLFFQQERKGRAGVGEPWLRALYDFTPLVSPWGRARGDLIHLIKAASVATYGRAPSRLDMGGWFRGMVSHGFIMSSPLAGHEALSRGEARAPLRRLYYEDEDFSFPGAYDRAQARALIYLEALEGWMTGRGGRETFMEVLTDRDLGP